jgi:hypothetical protein
MTEHTMVVTEHSSYTAVVYTLFNPNAAGLQSVTVTCNASNVGFWGIFFGSSATLGVPASTFGALWIDVTNLSRTTTLTLQCTGGIVSSFSWNTV